MARIWGNEPTQIEQGKADKKGENDVTSHLDDDDEDQDQAQAQDSPKQHGGAGFEPEFLQIPQGLFRVRCVELAETSSLEIVWLTSRLNRRSLTRRLHRSPASGSCAFGLQFL